MKVLHAPQHMSDGLEKNLQTILKLKPKVAHLTEQDAGSKDNVDEIRRIVGHKYHVCAGPSSQGGHSRENIIFLRKSLFTEVDGVLNQKLSNDLGLSDNGIDNDRWMLTVKWSRGLRRKKRKKYAHIGTHWNAVIQNKETGELLNVERARVMDTSAGPKLERTIQLLHTAGHAVTGSADFNYRSKLPKAMRWKYAPLRIFNRVGMAVEFTGLDYLFWTERLFKVKKRQIIEAGTGGNFSDHPWILVTLVRA